MNEIKFDKRNYRKHDKKNKSLIKKSLEKFGAGRSIVVDAEGEIIGGNGVRIKILCTFALIFTT